MDGYQTTHEWDSEVSLSYTIIEALATVQETDPTELEPLNTAVDVEALDRLFESFRDSPHSNGTERVEFTVDGHRITATSSGEVTVQRQPTARPNGGVADEAAFQVALAGLLQEAAANGVDVRGGWPVERSDVERAWDVMITGLSRRSTATIDDTEFPASAVLDAVAEREGVDKADLPPLYDAIGPDILEILHESDADSGQSVTFEYCGYSVTVSSDGSVVLDG